MNKKILLGIVAITLATSASYAQQGDPRATEYYSPVPKVVTPGQTCDNAPSDAIVLFDGTSLNEWEAVKNPASGNNWKSVDHIMTVDKTVGDIQTKKRSLIFSCTSNTVSRRILLEQGRPGETAVSFSHRYLLALVVMNCRC